MIRLLLVLILSCLWGAEAHAATVNDQVRIAILRNVSHFVLTVEGRFEIIDDKSGKSLTARVRLRPALVALKSGDIQLGDSVFDQQRITIVPRRDALMSVNNKNYRGRITIIKDSGKSITVVNSIELEDYIRGVLYHEISDKWPLEAIKAQAVATRTYAVYSMRQFAGRDFDMTSDIYSQVYGGQSAERYRTSLAVRRTSGEVLTYKGKVFPAFFHANCGGVTENAKELWGIDIPPLNGGIASPFSVDSPHYQWRKNFRLKDIQQKLIASRFQIGEIKEIRVSQRNASGRVRMLEITSREGEVKEIDGKSFRDIIGPNTLKSNKYDIVMKGWYVDFEGNGWGHGVGLCQWGAYGMAKSRYDYKEILGFYYPQSVLSALSDLQ